MAILHVKTNPDVNKVFDNYPPEVKKQMCFLRKLILDVAEEIDDISHIEETLKWGEPSYITKHGSTLRMDWKSKFPNQYALYFQCTSRLVDTFKLVFGTTFIYEGNRAIILALDQKIPIKELRSCIKATLQYHKVKHLVSLGI